MSVRLEVSAEVPAGVEAAWAVLTDWVGQRDWIPLTTCRVTSDHDTGLGVHVSALSGWWLGGVPVGLLDRFVVTGWRPPHEGHAELEILHLGPYFTGPGVFAFAPSAGGTTVRCVEVFDVPAAPLTERFARALLPVMRAGFRSSLAKFGRLAEVRERA